MPYCYSICLYPQAFSPEWPVKQKFCHLVSDLLLVLSVVQQFCHLVSADYYNLDVVPVHYVRSYYAIVLRWCQAIGRYDRPLIHVNPTTKMGREGGGEITPVHPFNHPSLLISSPSNPWSISSEINLKTVKSTPRAPHHRNSCVLYFFCSLICASFVSRFVFIPSCIRNKLYKCLLCGSMFNISTLHTAVRSYSICMLKPLSYISLA